MKEHELHWTLHFSSKHFYERQQWHDEKRSSLPALKNENGLIWPKAFYAK